MNCEQAQSLLHAYADNELDPANALQFETHLHDCESCRRASDELNRLRRSMSPQTLYYSAPPELSERVRSRLQRRTAPARMWRWPAIAAAILVAGIAGAVLSRSLTSDTRLADEVLSEHIRSLMATHLVDVPSSDQHTVKPWFDGRIDFAPSVNNFTDEGFPLYGGRLDYLNGRSVAALIYQRHKHFINVFIWPDAGTQSPTTTSRNGYNMIHWNQDGMAYWAVSDLNDAELSELVQLLRNNSTTRP